MGYLVKMPKLGLEMKQGAVVEWHVDEGGSVSAGDAIVEIESEKSTAEVEAREDGVLRRWLVAIGDPLPPGTPIGIVAGADEDIADLEAEAEDAAPTPEDVPVTGEEGGEQAAAEPTEKVPSEGADGDAKVTPRARRRARDADLDLSTVTGTGPQGAITEEDVERALAGGEKAAPGETTTDAASGEGLPAIAEERPLSGMRRTIADRLGESYRNAVHVTEHRTADAEALVAAAEAADEALATDVSIPDVLLLAVSAGLSEHPAFNATFEDGTHRIYAGQNVGIAVDVEGGLVAPVLRGIDDNALSDVADERRAITQRTLDGDYTTADLRGGTFTVTNLGTLGVEQFDPIINPPQVAILGVNAIGERVVPHEGEAAIRRQLPLSLSFDHRVVDGADAARFLGSLVAAVEDPWPLLPETVPRPG